MADDLSVRSLFLATAAVVVDAVADDAVGRAWDAPSVLEEQEVGGLAGHLARGAVWVVGDYLDAPVPDAPRVDTAGRYFADLMDDATPAFHRDIRARGAQVGARGQDELVTELRARLDALAPRLRAEPADRIVGVAGGVCTMALDEYLRTRVVEQVVHLDDLARSVPRDPWPVPAEAVALVLGIGVDVGRRRRGDAAMIRALYRSTPPGVLPVL